ncbi:hypothetical protein [Cryptosporidium parvum Iowa II]|uniref:Uncharacterized protein n=2 Tax=Cryptosporidium parvum TaxID=5807 RepID=Q5CUH0_CRYPI|nr:hypothetical protein [Cryptosporidium parvum Iowa II]EAK89042.1 hypothetical protein cgd3_2860 [Cryptosporidium parvum Iowa II]QOY42640.1 Uncharacterized protein with EF-hand domain [Cryptosporidium parvum]WKS77033.1 hypothetical protein CPCDC_3g2860 [Cryptosporidium sp. 43IA8]WRK31525.1 EF-hand domain protein [Cryptosporidium parvum]|eukprot:QOY42640.1 hypothetical protein CPATCC_001295 [Cryptosporidium parvum]
MNANNLKSSLYSSLFLSNGHSSKLGSETPDSNKPNLKIKNLDIKVNNSRSKIINKQISLNSCEKSSISKVNSKCLNSNSVNTTKSNITTKYNSNCLTNKNNPTSELGKFSLLDRSDDQSIVPSNIDSNAKNKVDSEDFNIRKNKDSEDFKVLGEKKIQLSEENADKNNLFNIENQNLEKEVKNDIYLRSNLIKVSKDDNNEVIISVPCKLNMDLESLFYYFSNNSVYLKCKQFASMLHLSKLYHKSKPIDILGRMFPSSQENLPSEERQIEYNLFLKLLHRFSQFKFRSIGATEDEKLNLVVSFLLSCDYADIISNKLIRSERSIQVNDPTMQRKDKDIQIKAELRDSSIQIEQSLNSVAVDATFSVADASCYCDIEQELNLTNIQRELDDPSNEEHQNQVFDYLNVYNIQDQLRLQEIVVKPELEELNQQDLKKSEKKNLQKKKIQKISDPESEILVALTSINQEDDKKLYRIFVYYSGPNSDRLSYRQFYNLMNDSGLLGGNFEEYITPIQLERCYSAVITNPKGLDYWEFKEILLYCGEASSCGNDPISAFQIIIRKYIIPLILMIYQPNNFEKCEDVVLDQSVSGEFDNVKSLQTMINKAILPWFRLGSRPILSDESDEYSETCSCSSFDSHFDSFEDKQSSISSSNISSSATQGINTQTPK